MEAMKIVVLTGGISTERDVSLSSGSKIYQALRQRGHNVVLVDVFLGYEGEGAEDIFRVSRDWTAENEGILQTHPDLAQIRALRPDGDSMYFGPHVITICRQADIVFMALHGDGETGRIQAAFDLMGIRYTGSDYVSSAIAMDKALAKELFFHNGIPTPESFALKKGEQEPVVVSFPCVVKVCSGGSSVGVYICEDEAAYEAAKQEAYTYDGEILVEQYIRGREFSVGVIEGKALPAIEIVPLSGFYDYKNKYQAGSTVETCPADISREAEMRLRRTAEAVFRVLRLKAYARMDFMMNEAGEVFCLEANTLPGMTPTSLLPQEAAAQGMDYGTLCEHLIEVSLRK